MVAGLASDLVRRGHAVTVATFDRSEARPFYDFDPRVELRRLGIGDVERGTSLREMIARTAALRRTIREIRPDVAVGFMHSGYIPLGFAVLGRNVPVVASEHISYEHYRTRRLEAAVLKLTPLLARTITTISPAIRDGFPSAIRRRMVILPNPVSAEDRRPADVAGEGRPHKTLLAVGRLEKQKDQKTLVGAFARIAGDFPDWRLRIVGEGSLRGKLEAQSAALALADRVALPGATARVDEEYVAAQLFAMPSTYESFGLTTAEALSHGLPVVGFADCPGTNELVKDGVNGLLVRGEDREVALACALRTLMGDPDRRRRLGAAGPASIEAFAPERIADLWEDLLRRVAARSPENP